MNASRLELEGAANLLPVPANQTAPLLGLVADVELETVPNLPRDHPSWMRDAFAVSARARALLASLRPLIIRVLTFWDHHVRSITIGGRNLGVDASGSYRLD